MPGSAGDLYDPEGDVVCTPGYNNNTLTWDIGSLPYYYYNSYYGEDLPVYSGTVTFLVTVNPDVSAGTVIANTASITCAQTATALTSTATTPVITSPPALSLTASAAPATCTPGAVITFTLHYADALAAVTGLTLTDTLPANLTYVPGSASSVSDSNEQVYCVPSYNAGTLTWDIGALPHFTDFNNGESNSYESTGYSVTFQATVNAGVANGTVIADTASLNYTGAPAPVTGTALVTVSQPPLLTLSTTADHTCCVPGTIITYTVSCADSLADASNIILTDTLPANVTYLPGSMKSNFYYEYEVLDSGFYGENDGTLTWNLGNTALNIGPFSESITFQVMVNAGVAEGTVLTNSASVSCTEAPIPVTSTCAVTVSPTVLSLTNTANQTSCSAGAVVSYTLNFGVVQATNSPITLTDTLPANLTYLPGSASSVGNYYDNFSFPTYNAGTLTWTLGSSTNWYSGNQPTTSG